MEKQIYEQKYTIAFVNYLQNNKKYTKPIDKMKKIDKM